MKTIIYYKFNIHNDYRMDIKDTSSDHPIMYLAEFLMQDLGRSGVDSFIKWLEDRIHTKIDSTNWALYSAILQDGMINIDPLIYDEDVKHDWPCNCNVFKTTREKMLEILKRYKEVRAIRPYPNKIIFTQDDSGEVSIKPED